jgi:hypothetical protein
LLIAILELEVLGVNTFKTATRRRSRN